MTYTIRIQGRRVNINLARIVYKCAECHGELIRAGAGLRCKMNPAHRHFIHQKEVAALKEKQQNNLNKLDEHYVIKDGKVVSKWQLLD